MEPSTTKTFALPRVCRIFSIPVLLLLIPAIKVVVNAQSSTTTTRTEISPILTSDCVDAFVQCGKHPVCNDCYDSLCE